MEQPDIPKTYIKRGKWLYVEMVFTSPEELNWAFGEGWHKREMWDHNVPGGPILREHVEVMFKTPEQVMSELSAAHLISPRLRSQMQQQRFTGRLLGKRGRGGMFLLPCLH